MGVYLPSMMNKGRIDSFIAAFTACLIVMLFATGCPKKGPVVPAPPTAVPATPTPVPSCGFISLGQIGCKAGGLTVIKSLADWTAYESLATCGTSVGGALTAFNFSTQMVINYDHYNCDVAYFNCTVAITEICYFWDRIEVTVNRICGDAGFPNTPPNLAECSGTAVSVPQSSLPVVVILTGGGGLPPP